MTADFVTEVVGCNTKIGLKHLLIQLKILHLLSMRSVAISNPELPSVQVNLTLVTLGASQKSELAGQTGHFENEIRIPLSSKFLLKSITAVRTI